MVFALVLITVIIFLTVDFILRKEDRVFLESDQRKKSPIFLSPERALNPLQRKEDRLYHPSHSWALPMDDDYVYIGFDDFISTLFSTEVKVGHLPTIGRQVSQGAKIWDVQFNGHKISQLAPVSGKVVDINPACKVEIPLQAKDLEQSWILKMKPDNLNSEVNNLMKHTQVNLMNAALKDHLLSYTQQSQFLNDGGNIDPAFISNLTDSEWNALIEEFFPYLNNQ